MSNEPEFKPGDLAVYSEEGKFAVVRVLANRCDAEQRSFDLRVLGNLPSLGRRSLLLEDLPEGHEFTPWHALGHAYAGMWDLRTVAEFTTYHPWSADLLARYRAAESAPTP